MKTPRYRLRELAASLDRGRGRSARSIAAECGLHPNPVSGALRGSYIPRRAEAQSLASVLGLSLEAFYELCLEGSTAFTQDQLKETPDE